MRKAFWMLVLLAMAAGGGYYQGYRHGQEGVDSLALVHSLEKTSMYANLLNAAPGGNDSMTRVLDQQLRDAVDAAEELSASAKDIEIEMPNLVDGLRRAKVYAQRKGDAELERRVTALQEKIRTALK